MQIRLFLSSVLILCAIILIALGNLVWEGSSAPTAPAYNKENLIRLHILANSNSPVDQELKLKVRDAILQAGSKLFAKTTEKTKATAIIKNNLRYLEAVARETIQAEGQTYPVRAEYGVSQFPTRSYGALTLAAGDYQSLRLIIGEGKGENWWCVLFPPLCFLNTSDKTTSINPKPQLAQAERQPIQFKFKLFNNEDGQNKAQRPTESTANPEIRFALVPTP